MTAFARTAQAARVRRSKEALLPIARAEADRVSLQVHVALDAMRRKSGNLDAACTLCQVMIVTGLLVEAGYGDATFKQMKEAEGTSSFRYCVTLTISCTFIPAFSRASTVLLHIFSLCIFDACRDPLRGKKMRVT